jgi:hypothetical protein
VPCDVTGGRDESESNLLNVYCNTCTHFTARGQGASGLPAAGRGHTRMSLLPMVPERRHLHDCWPLGFGHCCACRQ